MVGALVYAFHSKFWKNFVHIFRALAPSVCTQHLSSTANTGTSYTFQAYLHDCPEANTVRDNSDITNLTLK